jgi:hypothetical protein
MYSIADPDDFWPDLDPPFEYSTSGPWPKCIRPGSGPGSAKKVRVRPGMNPQNFIHTEHWCSFESKFSICTYFLLSQETVRMFCSGFGSTELCFQIIIYISVGICRGIFFYSELDAAKSATLSREIERKRIFVR